MDFSLISLESPPKTLYHYTSLEALVAIVQSKRLRASNIRFLNDRSESLRLREEVLSLLRTRASSEGDQQLIGGLIEMIGGPQYQSLFVASLSEKSDLLSQWRAYCPPGLGACIGFSSASLSEQFIANPKGGEPFFKSAQLQKVRYYSSENQQDLEAMLERLLSIELKSGHSGNNNAVFVAACVAPIFLQGVDLDKVTRELLDTIIEVEGKPGFSKERPPLYGTASWLWQLSPFIKHHAFAEEHEWRKVISRDTRQMPGQSFRQGKSTLIPFVEVMLDVMRVGSDCVPSGEYFIDEVIVGPTPEPELTLEAVRSLFDSEGRPEVIIRSSSIPFRSW